MNSPGFESARLTVRLGAVAANFRVVQRLVGPAAVAGVVKADAYGMGMGPVARSLAAAGCDTFFVARIEEGVKLRPLVPQARIFVLDGATADAVPALIGHRLTPVLNSLSEIAGWNAAARETGGTLDAAIHIDTGMSRLGLPASELGVLSADSAKRLSYLRLVLLMSHLACADEIESRMNRLQLERFRTALAMLPPAPASLASTGGVLLGKDFAFDMVRPGIGLYGVNPQAGAANPFSVVALLTAGILQLRRIEAGESVGYGARFVAERPSVLATAGLGYADGILRSLSNRGSASIVGVRVPYAGRVSMDLVTLDVTDVPLDALVVGAPVEFFGTTVTVDELAVAAETAPYEILTSLARRIPHHYEAAA